MPTTTRPGPTETSPALPVVVIGAGPVGLAAAAHLRDRGLPFVVLEAGTQVGASVREWAHIRTFTPWQHLVDPTAEKLLAPTGWTRPTTPVPPTGGQLAEQYLEPLGALLADDVRLRHRVVALTRDGLDKSRTVGRAERPFLVRVSDDAGRTRDLPARAVIDATGTWERRNPLGAGGLPARGEEDAAEFLVGPLPDVLGRDRSRFAGKRTLVVGGGHSAANTLLSLGLLAREVPGTQVVWAIRGTDPARVYGGGPADELPARGRLGTDLRGLVGSGAVELVTGFATTAIEVTGDTVAVVGTTAAGERRIEGLHQVAAATGFRPDLSILSEVRLDLDPGLEAPRRLAPLIDPAFHSCGTVPPHGHRDLAQPDDGFYVVGMKSYGRAPTFLITTGNEQVRSVVAALAGDLAAADEVQLVLPETGVCSVDATGTDTGGTGTGGTGTGGTGTGGTGGAAGCCGAKTGLDGLTVPAEAHQARPAGTPARGFATGLPGGGRLAELAVTEVGASGNGVGSGAASGCCSG
ncbi:FAD-dependent oxidoreductase [Cellulomonas fimi]|uniref:NAD(P)-binding domain-containing protein n=1 Tax=Cellulomonas fimi TaxID=1708 RepID=A0A7Y0LVS1_CELFI|nr:FAD-dependent oxidoreductase [Cellulomonas fimi]NMR19073.1 NAD(P)-binding domain-containing protein [Cellulomonas fimi]